MKQDYYNFPKPSHADWIQQIQREGTPLHQISELNSTLWEELPIQLFYTQDDAKSTSAPATFHIPDTIPGMPPRIWYNLETIHPDDLKTANTKVLNALENGAEGLVIYMENQIQLDKLLQDVMPEYIQLYFLVGKNKISSLNSIWEWVQNKSLRPDQLKGAILWSPFKELLEGDMESEPHFDLAAELIQKWNSFPDFYPLCLDFGKYTDSGATGIQELKYGLSELIELVDKLNQRNLDTSLIFKNIAFQSAVGAAYFPEIAKLKALRVLISSLATQYQLEINPESIHIIASTSNWPHALLDPNNNLIRQTYQVMSAILGGANAVWIKNLAGKSTSTRENRTARNCSTILREEAYLDKFIDPAAGSYFLDNLSSEITLLVQKHVSEQEIEGGWLKSFSEGKIQSEIRKTRYKRQTAILEKNKIQVGVNKYNLHEKHQMEMFGEEIIETEFELKPARASYLIELQTLKSR